MPALPKCLIKKCNATAGNVKEYKGLCVKCFSSAKKMVLAEDTTWEELESMGLAILSADPFHDEFKALKG